MTTEPPTPTQIANQIRAACAIIADLWDDMLTPTSATHDPNSIIPTTRHTPTSDDANTSADLPRTLRIINLRREIHRYLFVWADIIHARTPDHGHPGMDVPTVANYLADMADHLASEPDAQDALEGITDSVEAIEHAIYGAPTPGQLLGPCPQWGGCDGVVRVIPNERSHDGTRLAACTRCRVADTVTTWAAIMAGGWARELTTQDVIDLAHNDYGIDLTPNAVHQLTKRGSLHPIADTRPSRFHLTGVVDYLHARRART